MKKRLIGFFLVIVFIMSTLPANIVFADTNNSYMDVVNETILKFGNYSSNDFYATGTIYGEFIDFDGNGIEEMLLIYKEKNSEKSNWANILIYGYQDNKLVKLLDDELHGELGQTDVSYHIVIKEMDGKTYLVYNAAAPKVKNGDCEIIKVFTVENGLPKFDIYYDETLPWWNNFEFIYTKCTINNVEVSEEEYFNSLSKYNQGEWLNLFDGEDDTYYSHCSQEKFSKFLEEAKSKVPNTNTQTEAENNLTVDAAVSYKSIIENSMKKYGEFQIDEYGLYTGVGLVKIIDFDNNGSKELVIGYSVCHGDYEYSMYTEIYGYNGDAFLIEKIQSCGSFEAYFALKFLKAGDRVFTAVENDTVCASCQILGTVENGRWVTTEYYDHSELGHCDYTTCVDAGKVIFRINDRIVAKEEFEQETGKYTTYDNDWSFGDEQSLEGVQHIYNIANLKEQDNYDIANPKEQNAYDMEQIRLGYVSKLMEISTVASDLEDNCYYVYDINKDSIPELIIKRGTCEADYYFSVYSFSEETKTVKYVGDLLGGHISLVGVEEKGILLYMAHMGYEEILEGQLNNNRISYRTIYKEDCSRKEYSYDRNIGKFRAGAVYLDKCNNLSDYSLLNSYFETLKNKIPPINVILNREQIVFEQQPVIINGNTMVPMRVIFEKLGANVEWEQTTQTITAKKGQTTISISIGKYEMRVNGKSIRLDVAPQLIGDSTFVPVRAVAESFGATVEWNNENRTVTILTHEAKVIMERAKYLFLAVQNMGGLEFFANMGKVDMDLYNAMNDVNVTIAEQELTLDVVAFGTKATLTVASVASAAKKYANEAGVLAFKEFIQSSEIRKMGIDLATDIPKSVIAEEIMKTVPDLNAFVLKTGRDAYKENVDITTDIMSLHAKFMNDTYTYSDAVDYITLYYMLMINRATMSMVVQVLVDDLPENFLESLEMSAGTAGEEILNFFVGDLQDYLNLNMSEELYKEFIVTYVQFAMGETDGYIEYLYKLNNPIIDEWIQKNNKYKQELEEKLSVD